MCKIFFICCCKYSLIEISPSYFYFHNAAWKCHAQDCVRSFPPDATVLHHESVLGIYLELVVCSFLAVDMVAKLELVYEEMEKLFFLFDDKQNQKFMMQ